MYRQILSEIIINSISCSRMEVDNTVGGKRPESKNPRVNHSGTPFFIPIAKLPIREERDFLLVRAGLPALGSPSGRPSRHHDSGYAAFVPDHGGGSAADSHRFPFRPLGGLPVTFAI